MFIDNIQRLLLNSREEKFNVIKSFSNLFSVIEISVNTPYFPKNNIYTDVALKKSLDYIINLFPDKIKNIHYFYNYSGNFILIEIDKDPILLKKELVKFENKFRIIDIDIYLNKNKITSKQLNLPSKKCFVCGKDIWFCRINNMHSKNETIKAFKSIFLKLIELNDIKKI